MRADRGVVDQDVDAPELGHRLADHGVDLVPRGDIGDDRDRLDAAVADLARHRLGFLLVAAGVDDDMGALARQPQRRGAADVAAGAGDQCDLAIELTHRLPPVTNAPIL